MKTALFCIPLTFYALLLILNFIEETEVFFLSKQDIVLAWHRTQILAFTFFATTALS